MITEINNIVVIVLIACMLYVQPVFAQSSGFDINGLQNVVAPTVNAISPSIAPTGSWANTVLPVVINQAVQTILPAQTYGYMSIPRNSTNRTIVRPFGLPGTSTSGVSLGNVDCPNCRESGAPSSIGSGPMMVPPQPSTAGNPLSVLFAPQPIINGPVSDVAASTAAASQAAFNSVDAATAAAAANGTLQAPTQQMARPDEF